MKRLITVFLVALVPLLSGAAQSTGPVLTLQQTIDSALANGQDNKVLQANLDVARAQHALNVSKNSFSLAGLAGYGQNWTLYDPYGLLAGRNASSAITGGVQAGLTLAGPLTSVSVSPAWAPPASATADPTGAVAVSVSQTLWNGYWGGPTQAAVDKSLLTLQGKELAAESGRLSLIYKIKQAYYTMLAAQRNLALKNDILDKQNAVLKQISTIYDLKLASLVDLQIAQINAKSAQVDVDSANHDLRFARIALATLMAMPIDSSFTVADAEDPAMPAKTIDEAVAEGLKQRVDIRQVQLTVQSATIDIALTRGQATPTVSVSGGLSVAFDLGGTIKDGGIAGASVKIAMPILDAGAAQNQIDAIQRQNDVYSLQETQLQQSITTDIQNAWEGVQLANERLDLAKLQAESSTLQLQIMKTEFDKGTAANQDLLTATVNDANAQTALEAARSAAQLAVLQLQSVMGL